MSMVRGPTRFDRVGAVPSAPPPLPGEQSAEVVMDLRGLDQAECLRMIKDGVTAVPQVRHVAE